MPEDFWESLWNPVSYMKVAFLLFTYPIWGPILKIIWEEIQEALAPEGGVYGKRERREIRRRPAGLDPWVNVPLARHRQRVGGGPAPRANPEAASERGRPSRAGSGPLRRSSAGAPPASPVASGGGGKRRGF